VNRIYSEPALLAPKFFPYIWGGTLLRDHLGKDIPSDDIGESWEVSAHPRGQSVIASGPARGMPFGEYALGSEFYGAAPQEKFPLLIKFLGAADNLSVQVHPGDDDCRPGEAGKAEAWVVVACRPGAELIYGIDGSAEEFARAVAEGRMADRLRRLKVSPGDVLDIPAGTVHALTAGIVVYEVQQNSDTTYRLYDWGRVDAATGRPRELHIEAALRVVKSARGQGAAAGRAFRERGCVRTVYIHTPRFTLEKLETEGVFKDVWFDSFAAYSVIEGAGAVLRGGRECFRVKRGDSFVSPAAAGPVEFDGRMTLLKSHVPPEGKYQRWLDRCAV
jgi:mannose-6-phosphate isomerase